MRLWGVLLCVLVVAGCAALVELSKLVSRVEDNGYTRVSVKHGTTNGFDTMSVDAYNINQPTDDELLKAYGPRKVQPAGGSSSGAVVAWVLVGFLAVGGLIATVIVRRRRRRRERTMPPYPPGPNNKP